MKSRMLFVFFLLSLLLILESCSKNDKSPNTESDKKEKEIITGAGDVTCTLERDQYDAYKIDIRFCKHKVGSTGPIDPNTDCEIVHLDDKTPLKTTRMNVDSIQIWSVDLIGPQRKMIWQTLNTASKYRIDLTNTHAELVIDFQTDGQFIQQVSIVDLQGYLKRLTEMVKSLEEDFAKEK